MEQKKRQNLRIEEAPSHYEVSSMPSSEDLQCFSNNATPLAAKHAFPLYPATLATVDEMHRQFEEAQTLFNQRQSSLISFLLSHVRSQRHSKDSLRRADATSKARTTIFEFADDSDSDGANNSPALLREDPKAPPQHSRDSSLYSEPRDQKPVVDLLDRQRTKLMRYQLDLKKTKSQLEQHERATLLLLRELKRYGAENALLRQQLAARPCPSPSADCATQTALPTKKINLKRPSRVEGGEDATLESEERDEDESELNISQQHSSAAEAPPHSMPMSSKSEVEMSKTASA